MAREATVIGSDVNRMLREDEAIHNWYRFVLSYPPHLVREYLKEFNLREGDRVLDPFCGTGTTLVECKKQGIESLGFESHPMAYFASAVKLKWDIDSTELMQHALRIADLAKQELLNAGIQDEPIGNVGREHDLGAYLTLPEEQFKLLLKGSINPLPLHKTLVLFRNIQDQKDSRFYDYERLALAKSLVTSIGNLHFGPEVGVGKKKDDAAVIAVWLDVVRTMAKDLSGVQDLGPTSSSVHREDSRAPRKIYDPQSIDAVITSPPYPNEKDYTRTTRLESVLLGFIRSRAELQAVKRGLVRSNTRTVYKGDDDDRWVENHEEVQRIADTIESRRISLGKTSGFERMYPRVARLYFGGMARHLEALKPLLKPGAKLAYVVGDQASYLRVMIRTGSILADIAELMGYRVIDIKLFRTRLATATRTQMKEEVVILEWPGGVQ